MKVGMGKQREGARQREVRKEGRGRERKVGRGVRNMGLRRGMGKVGGGMIPEGEAGI